MSSDDWIEMKRVAVIAVVIFGLTACGSLSTGQADSVDGNLSSGTPAESVVPVVDPGCLQVSEVVRSNLEGALDSEVTGNTLSRATAYVASEREQVWFVAAEIVGDGIAPGQAQGLWATNGNPDGSTSGMYMSVDAFAKEFSDWPDGGASTFEMSQFEAGAQEALDCLKALP